MNTVSFVSTRGRGTTLDLRLVREYLFEKDCDMRFQYYNSDETLATKLQKKYLKDAKNSFLETASHCICVDGSLPSKVEREAKEGRKNILIAQPYDYQFELFFEKPQSKKKNFVAFDRIVPGCPFTEKLFETYYEMKSGCEMLKDTAFPLAFDLMDRKKSQSIRDDLKKYFPTVGERKIISLLLYKENKTAVKFDVDTFMEWLPKDWFFLTNSAAVTDMMYCKKEEVKDSFGYINRYLRHEDILHISDALITNYGYYAVNYANTKNPLYYLNTSGKAFEKYMDHYFPEMNLGTRENLINLPTTLIKKSEGQKKFYKEFGFEISNSPYEAIRNEITGEA